MIDLGIAPDFQAKIPGLTVACITAGVRVAEHDAALWREIEAAAARFRGMAMDDARKLPPIKALRDAYRALGNDPTRYRGSNEALVRRISQGKELYRVNTVVDVNNLISLETLHSAGAFDLAHVRPPIIFRVGQPGESYLGIGRGQIHIAGLPIFADELGPFGSTTSDSERAMVRLETTRVLMVIISFRGPERLDEALRRAAGLLETYAQASGVETALAGETPRT
jgi:DNA/RNA-binding domain of Phe-tRNA-synthetase-like protein